MMTLPTSLTAHADPNHPIRNLTGLSRLRWAVKNPPADPQVTFASKVVLVTGANTGLGFEAALKYAQKGCSKLVLAVRSLEKGEEAKRRIIESCGRDTGDGLEVKVLKIDMVDYDSIKAFVGELEKYLALGDANVTYGNKRLDIALLNAGLANPRYVPSPTTGHDMAVQVNVMGTAVLAFLLFPLLKESTKSTGQKSHLTFVNSIGHAEVERKWYAAAGKSGSLNSNGNSKGSLLAFVDVKEGWDQRKSYTAVKALGMAVMLHFSALSPDAVIVNSTCPYFCRTNLGRNFAAPLKALFGAWQYFMARSAEEGSRSLVGATALGEESQGQFWFCDTLYP